MDITPSSRAGAQVINAYGGGGFRIAGRAHAGSVLVFPDRTLPWPPASMADLDAASFAEIHAAAHDVEILLVGCGATGALLPKAIREGLSGAGIVAECMNTGAACRTFNVLLAEERPVAAALIAVE